MIVRLNTGCAAFCKTQQRVSGEKQLASCIRGIRLGMALTTRLAAPPTYVAVPSSSDQEITIVEKEKDIDVANAASKDIPHNHDHGHSHSHGVVEETAASQIVGIAILEFGVVLHR